MAEFGAKVRPKKAGRLEASLGPSLVPNETIWLIVRANGVRPAIDHLVITSSRLIAAHSATGLNAKEQVFSNQYVSESVVRTVTAPRMLILRGADGATIKFGSLVHETDVPRLLQVLEYLRINGHGAQAHQQAEAMLEARQRASDAELDSRRPSVLAVDATRAGSHFTPKQNLVGIAMSVSWVFVALAYLTYDPWSMGQRVLAAVFMPPLLAIIAVVAWAFRDASRSNARPMAPRRSEPSLAERRAEWNRLRPTLSGTVWERDQGRCVRCRTQLHPGIWTVDHRIPLSRGGTNQLSNLQLMCRSCNSREGAT